MTLASINRGNAVKAQWQAKTVDVGGKVWDLSKFKSYIKQISPDITETTVFGIGVLADVRKKTAINFCFFENRFQESRDKNALANIHKVFEDGGWKLISVFEDEVVNSPEIILSRCRNIFKQISHKIYARKCKIVEVPVRVARKFLSENHIQGAGGSICIGLEYDGALVSVATFSAARFNPTAKYELIRFASKLNTVVVGGASKLLMHARLKVFGLDAGIVSYADKRYGLGEVYSKCGFSKINLSAPCYWYYKFDNVGKKFHRSAFQKHKLEKLLDEFDPNKTELVNMRENGWCRIFDAGCAVYITHPL